YLDSFIGTIISSELMEFTFENILISRVRHEDHGGEYSTNSFMVSVSIVVNFNQELYKNNADFYDLNNLDYVWIFAPESHEFTDVPAIMNIGIEPLELNTITPKFYPNAEGLSSVNEIEIPEELESEYVVRNRKGLLKVSLDPEFNNSSYVTITSDIDLKNVLDIGQMSALINNTGVSSYVSGYEDVLYKDSVLDEDAGRYGIRLSKLSTNYRNDILFDNVYYISLMLNASSEMVGEDIRVYITSYKIFNGVSTATLEQVVVLKVYDLPEISITLENGEKQGFVAVGSSVPVNISIDNFTGKKVPFSFSVNSNANDGKFYFVNDENELVRNEFDVEYLNNGGKYYLCADASAQYGQEHNIGVETFKVILKVQESILGSVETVTTSLSMQVVEMTINNVSVNGTIDTNNRNEMQILHGESVVLSVSLDVNDVLYGDAQDLQDLILKNYSYYPNTAKDSKGNEIVFGTKEILEYLFAGTAVQLTKQNDTTGWIDYVTGNRNDSTFKIWFLEDYYAGEKVYVSLNVGSYDNFNVLSSSYRYSTTDYIADYLLYAIKGTTISDNTVIRCSIVYFYDNDGVIQLGYSSVFNTYELMFEFTLVVEDNSTYDHPNPIENAYDLANMEEGANYILINNIATSNKICSS
ncbi:MAG: hypothetical protein IJW28_05530, partial [Clostridia bacterium]|nr:hypothetical protein [Clostridia bacterium]